VSVAEGGARVSRTIWSLHFVLVLIASHLFFIGYYSLFVTLPRYLEGQSATAIGFVVGVFGVSSFVMRLWVGGLGDVFGRRLLALFGLTGAAISFGLYAVGPVPALLAPVRLLHGLAQVASATALVTLTGDLAPPARRAESIGYGFFAADSPALYAPLLALALAGVVGFGWQFVLMGLLSFAGALAVLPIPSGRPPVGTRRLPAPFRIARSALLPMAGFFGTTAGLGVVQAFLTVHVDRGHLGDPQVFFVAFGLAMIPAGPLAGRLGAAVGHRVVLVVSVVLAALAMLLAAVPVAGLGLALVGVLFGCGFAGAFTAAMTLAYESASDAERGLAIATTGLAFDLGFWVPLLLGPLADAAGTGMVFAVTAAIAALCVLPVALPFRVWQREERRAA